MIVASDINSIRKFPLKYLSIDIKGEILIINKIKNGIKKYKFIIFFLSTKFMNKPKKIVIK